MELKRFVYAIHIYNEDYQPKADFIFGKDGKPDINDKITICWDDIEQRRLCYTKYVINAYTVVYDERAFWVKELLKNKSK